MQWRSAYSQAARMDEVYVDMKASMEAVEALKLVGGKCSCR